MYFYIRFQEKKTNLIWKKSVHWIWKHSIRFFYVKLIDSLLVCSFLSKKTLIFVQEKNIRFCQ